MRIINKIGIMYNTMKKLLVQRRVEGAAIGDLYELHERVQHKFLERLISLRQSEDVEEGLEELVELGTEPREVAELGLVADDGGSGEGGVGRELGEEREEEGVEREEGFEDVVRRGRRGNEGEEKLVPYGFQLCDAVSSFFLLPWRIHGTTQYAQVAAFSFAA